MRLSRHLPVIFLLIIPSTIVKISCESIELTENNFQDTVDQNLFVFVLFYKPLNHLCMGEKQPGVSDFVDGARIAKENGMTEYLNLKFVKVNIEEQRKLADKYKAGYMTCTSSPKIIFFRYGRAIEYGGTGRAGQSSLSSHQLSTKGMFEFLDKKTQPAATIIKTASELQQFVQSRVSTVVAHFKENSTSKNKYWRVADRRKDYTWGAVTNQSLNEYSVDTIAINSFGASPTTLNKDLDEEGIENFVELNAIASGPILELNDKNFQDVIDTNLLVFVWFYDPECEIPDFFETGARAAAENGMTDYLNMKFAKINSKRGSSTFNRHKISLQLECSGWSDMVLFRYGELLKYTSNRTGIQRPETVEGLFQWLEKNTKPTAKIIRSEYELRTFVEYTEVTILGYFGPTSKTKLGYWKTAERLPDYKWAAVTNPYLNPYEMDTIVITQEYGVSRLMLNENLSEEDIEKFVKVNANSTFPVPTRIVPTIRPDMNETLNTHHRNQNVVFVYDRTYFAGNIDRIDLSSGCVDITGDWEQEVQSIRTFGQCVKVYDSFDCKSVISVEALTLNDSNIPVQMDLGMVGFHAMIRSIRSCNPSMAGESSDKIFAVNKVAMVISAIIALIIRKVGP